MCLQVRNRADAQMQTKVLARVFWDEACNEAFSVCFHCLALRALRRRALLYSTSLPGQLGKNQFATTMLPTVFLMLHAHRASAPRASGTRWSCGGRASPGGGESSTARWRRVTWRQSQADVFGRSNVNGRAISEQAKTDRKS